MRTNLLPTSGAEPLRVKSQRHRKSESIRAEAPAEGSVHDAVAAAVKVVRDSGVPNRTSSMFAEIGGLDWDSVMGVVKAATEVVLPFGSRVSRVWKADIWPRYSGELHGKVKRLETAIEGQ